MKYYCKHSLDFQIPKNLPFDQIPSEGPSPPHRVAAGYRSLDISSVLREYFHIVTLSCRINFQTTREHFLKKTKHSGRKDHVLTGNNAGLFMTFLSFRLQDNSFLLLPWPSQSGRSCFHSRWSVSPHDHFQGGKCRWGSCTATTPPISGDPVAPGTLIYSSKKAARWYWKWPFKVQNLCTFAGHGAMANSKSGIFGQKDWSAAELSASLLPASSFFCLVLVLYLDKFEQSQGCRKMS